MWSMTRAAACCLVVLAGCSCDDPRRTEARRLLDALQAVDVAATPARRAAQLEALKALPLADPGLAQTRGICVAVHEGLETAEREQAAARTALQAAVAGRPDGGVPPAAAESIRATIERSEEARARAHTALSDCERRTRALLLERK